MTSTGPLPEGARECSCGAETVEGPCGTEAKVDEGCPLHGEGGSMVSHIKPNVVEIRPRFNPCPAKLRGPFLTSDATEIRCGRLKGHHGPHRSEVEWEPDRA